MSETCHGCWWTEGGLCYLEPCARSSDGRSLKLAESRCGSFATKRAMLERLIPGDKLIILSELRKP